MSDTPETRTGAARMALADANQEDFAEVVASVAALAERAEKLALESGGINKLSTFWRHFQRRMLEEEKAISEKQAEAYAQLTSQQLPPPVVEIVDEGLAEQVREERAG